MNELDKVAEQIIHQCGCIKENLSLENIKILVGEYSQVCEMDSVVRKERDDFLKKVYEVE